MAIIVRFYTPPVQEKRGLVAYDSTEYRLEATEMLPLEQLQAVITKRLPELKTKLVHRARTIEIHAECEDYKGPQAVLVSLLRSAVGD